MSAPPPLIALKGKIRRAGVPPRSRGNASSRHVVRRGREEPAAAGAEDPNAADYEYLVPAGEAYDLAQYYKDAEFDDCHSTYTGMGGVVNVPDDPTTPIPKANEPYTIGFSVYYTVDEVGAMILDNMKKYAQEAGVELLVNDANYDQNLQNQAVEQWIVEGVDGVGYWEYLEFRLEPGKSVAFIELENGYWKSEDIFTKNGRPRALRISVGSPYSTTNWALIYPETDYEGKTFYALPGELTVDDSGKLYLVILDAMAGTKYEDTCISGVKFWGMEGAREESGAENAAGNGTENSSGNGADDAAGNDSGNSADSSAGDQSGSIAGSAESNSAETAGSAAQALPRDHAEMIKYIRGNYYYTQEHLADYTTDNGRLIFYLSYGIDLGDAGFNNLAYSMTSYNKGETVVKLAENHRNDPDSKLTMAEAFFLNPDYDAEREYGNPIHALLFIYALGKDSKEYRYYFRDGYVIRYIDPDHVTHDYEEGILIDDYALDHDPDGIFEAACIVPLMLSEHYYYIKSGMIER